MMSVTGKDPLSRNSSTQAMLSLVNAYDEDEDEGAPADSSNLALQSSLDDQFSGSEGEGLSPLRNRDSPDNAGPKKRTPEKVDMDQDDNTPKKMKTQHRMTKLVSYGEALDDEAEDEDGDEEGDQGTPEPPDDPIDTHLIDGGTFVDTNVIDKVEESDSDGLLPPEPPGKCSRHLQDKVAAYYEKMKTRRLNLNQSIQHKKEFRNPSIYEKLIQFCDIDEKGTNYPPELFDPSIWGPESYFTEIAKIQKEEMDKREKERKDKTKIEFVSGIKKDSSSKSLVSLTGEPARKSKWDNQGSVSEVLPGAPGVTGAASGTKTTVISALGTLKKTKS